MTWSQFAGVLQGDVQQEVLADVPSALHREAVAIGVAPEPPLLIPVPSLWMRFRWHILGIAVIIAVWYFFIRK